MSERSNVFSNENPSKVIYWKSVIEEALLYVRRNISKHIDELGSILIGENSENISTELDQYVGKIILKYLRKKRLSVRIHSEEFGVFEIGDNPTVSVFMDEVDGTSNVFHKIPLFATTITVLDTLNDLNVNKIVAGATLELPNGTVFSAGRNLGSYQDGQICGTSTNRILDDSKSMMIFDFYSEHQKNIKPFQELKCFKRDFGSNALHFSFVSSGRVEAFINSKQKLNDIGAGILLVEEAGGIITDFDGKNLDISLALDGTTSIVAACNQSIHKQILALLQK